MHGLAKQLILRQNRKHAIDSQSKVCYSFLWKGGYLPWKSEFVAP